ncbi:MAG: hypothetical protein EOO38_00110 [Cytophagaceae bacterium]|nr:MAG: hypothetical protein EOO38_00110 [Cytophagaceae bacterium]
MTSFGVGPTGFNRMRLTDCRADLEAGLTAAFGAGTNVSDATVFGQLAGVFAERFALLWEALGQTYDANTVAGAEGAGVDAILALNGILRLQARPTVTDPQLVTQANGLTLNGMVLYGTPGTTVPAGTILQTSSLPTLSFTTDRAVTIGTAVNARAQLLLSAQPTSGSFTLGLTAPSGALLTTSAIPYSAQANVASIAFTQPPTAFVVAFAAPFSSQTASIPASATAAQVQAAVQNVTPFTAVTVTQAGSSYALNFPAGPMPLVSVTFPGASTSVSVTQAVQAQVNALYDASAASYPFTDVSISIPSATVYTVSYGATKALAGQPVSSASQQATLVIQSNTLAAGTTAVNVAPTMQVTGRASQAVTTATCTVSGPNAVLAGSLNVIGSGVSGLTGCVNQLDCLTGADVETDVDAMARRATLLAQRGSGALSSLTASILSLSGVTAAIAFPNLTGAAQQVLMFSQTPSKGSYQLAYQGTPTASLAYNASASQLQTALGALPGLASVLVTGSNVFGFVIDFNGSFGGQSAQLMSVPVNSTDATLTPYYGRPPKSVELVVQGGSSTDVASALFAGLPAGIASYAQPILRTLGSTVAGNTSVSLVSVTGLSAGVTLVGQGLYPGTVVQSITGNTVTVTPAALGSYSNVPMVASNAAQVLDDAGNAHLVNFSRPTLVPLYVTVSLVTDTYLSPGNSNSGVNPAAKFNPACVAQIQAELLASANATPIGGTVIARGSNGLAGSFRDQPGILDYTLAFDVTSPPVNQNNLPLPAEGVATLESFNVVVSYN